MEVSVHESGQIEELVLKGRMDAVGANIVEEFLNGFLDGRGIEGRRILVNFEDVDYISSGGLRVFVGAIKKLHPAGSKIALFGMNVQVEEIFLFAGFDSIFPIRREKASAVQVLEED